MNQKRLLPLFLVIPLILFISCSSDKGIEGEWEFELWDEIGTMSLKMRGSAYVGSISSPDIFEAPIRDLNIEGKSLTGSIEHQGGKLLITGEFSKDTFTGQLSTNKEKTPFVATKVSDDESIFVKPNVNYTLTDSDLGIAEEKLDHENLIKSLDEEGIVRGKRIYNSK